LGGFRADKSNQLRNWIFSPRAGLSLGFTDNLNWRVAVSTGFRAPAVFDEDLHITQVGGRGFLIQNDPDLKEEKSVSFSTCLNYQGRVTDKQYRLAVNFFWTDLRSNHTLVEREVPDADYRQLSRINGPGSYVRGFDVSGDIRLTPALRLDGAVTFQTAHFDVGNDLPYTLFLPTYTATAWYHVCLDQALQADLRATLEEVEGFIEKP